MSLYRIRFFHHKKIVVYYLNTGCFLKKPRRFCITLIINFFAPFPLKLEKRKLDKKPILLERDDILKQELDQDVDSILSGMKYWVSHLDKVDFKKFCCWYQTFLNRRKSSSYFLPKMCHFILGIYIGAKLGGSGGSGAPAVFLVS